MAKKAALFSPVLIAEKVYLSGALVGLVIPYALVFLFVNRNGPNVRLFVDELFGNYAGALAMADLILSSVVFWFWLFSTERRARVQFLWIYVALNLAVGLCFAFPLFLYVRSRSDRRALGAGSVP